MTLCTAVFAGCNGNADDSNGSNTASQAAAVADSVPVSSDQITAKKPKYIFAFIGDGMSHVQINAAKVYRGNNTSGEVNPGSLNFTTFPVAGIATTHDSTSFCPDSASTATSIATGVKTHSGVIGMEADKTTVAKNISETLSAEKDMKIGIISSVTINHATPAAFYSHVPSRNEYYDIAMQMANSNFDYFAGGTISSNKGKDGTDKDVFDVLTENGFTVADTADEINSLNSNSGKVYAVVLETDESGVYNTGLIKQGDQRCRIEIKSGEHKGETVYANNMYTGKTEFDKVFVKGDTTWVLLEQNEDGEITFANMIDHYRVGSQLFLIGIFAVLLVCCFGFSGLKILLSFTFSLLFIWKALIPLMLHGFPPLAVALVVGNILSAATLILTLGVNKKAIIAMISTVACSLVTCLLAVGLGELFRINGAVMQWSESLLYAGFENLNLTAVFQAGIYLACSGAILDLAVDITSALEEVVIGNEKIGRGKLFHAGMRIGRSVTGSQASTLLMAYMGSYLSVLMVYMAQGTPMLNILNSKSISAEILHTFVGCIGLILVCPLTAAVSSWIYTKRKIISSE